MGEISVGGLYLGSLYARSDDCKECGAIGRPIRHGDSARFTIPRDVHLERFADSTLKPVEYTTAEMGEVFSNDGSWRIKPTSYRARAWQWLNMEQRASKSLSKVVDKEHPLTSIPTPTLLTASLKHNFLNNRAVR